MTWHDFLKELKPLSSNQGSKLLETLKSFKNAPDVCWYPGSGDDLTPLMLDVPDNPTSRRLFRVGASQEKKPQLLWMNDYGEHFGFPTDEPLDYEYDPVYNDLWQKHKTSAVIGKDKESYLTLSQSILTLFTVNVTNRQQGRHARPETGDEYLVCFSKAESTHLFDEIFRRCGTNIIAGILIKQGDLSNQRTNFNQYKNLPDLVAKYSSKVGKVEYWVIDDYGLTEGKPIAKTLKNHRSLGGEVKWGWDSARIYSDNRISKL